MGSRWESLASAVQNGVATTELHGFGPAVPSALGAVRVREARVGALVGARRAEAVLAVIAALGAVRSLGSSGLSGRARRNDLDAAARCNERIRANVPAAAVACAP